MSGGGNGFPINNPYAITHGFGDVEQFKKLVKIFHDNDLKVMVDFGVHSIAWDSSILRDHPEWILKNEGGSFHSDNPAKHTSYIYMHRFDIRYQDVQDYMHDALMYWVKDIGIDAMRQDLAYAMFVDKMEGENTFPVFDFWRCFKHKALKVNPNFLLLGESANQGMLQNGFDLEYSGMWRVRHRILKKWLTNEKRPMGIVVHALSKMLPGEFADTKLFMMGLENHDYEPVTTGGPGAIMRNGFGSLEKANLYMAMITTLPCVPITFGGQAVNNRWFNLGDPKYAGVDQANLAYYQRLMRYRKQLALSEGDLRDLVDLTPGADSQLPEYVAFSPPTNIKNAEAFFQRSHYPDWAAYLRTTSAGRFVILLNHQDTPVKMQLSLGSLHPKTHIKQVINLTTGKVSQTMQILSEAWQVDGHQAVILQLDD